MLDVIGSAEELGKSVGTDQDKNTFVRLYGLERCEELVRKYTQYAISALDCFENSALLRQLALNMSSRIK
jgi:geranylgeranyl diphosphate synthase type II